MHKQEVDAKVKVTKEHETTVERQRFKGCEAPGIRNKQRFGPDARVGSSKRAVGPRKPKAKGRDHRIVILSERPEEGH